MHKIGVLDSGIGGLTTCSAIIHKVDDLNIIYYADNKNAPYGTKTKEEVLQYVICGVDYLISRNVELIVLACNTATTVVIDVLRRLYSTKFVGIEPAIKLAQLAGGKTLLLATPLTLKSNKVNKNIESFKNNIVVADTSDLAFMIEKQAPKLNNIDDFLYNTISPFENIKNIVLGCSHYSYLTPNIKKLFPNLSIFDGNNGVAEVVKKHLNITQFQNKNCIIDYRFSGKDETVRYQQCFQLSNISYQANN